MPDINSIIGNGEEAGGISEQTISEFFTRNRATANSNGGTVSFNPKDQKMFMDILKYCKEQHISLDKLAETEDVSKDQLKNVLEQGFKDNKLAAIKGFAEASGVLESVGKLLGSISKKIDNSISLYTKYSIAVNAAIQGTKTTYEQTVQNLTDALGGTGLTSMSDVLENMASLTEKGLVQNVEQHAFLMSIKDGIVHTFDAADSTLIRLIKLQGEDSTANRLAMQAALKEYLNGTYQNSQYVYEQFRDVSASLLEATSLLTNSLSNSLEATVQKWLGSLSSVGLSDNAVKNIANALGAVGSGNLSAISSSGMQNLVIMGATRAGLSYGDLMTGGLTAEQTNALMSSMVSYLASLQGNNVVLSEYAKIFGVSVSDLVAARNANKSGLSTMAGGLGETGLGRYLELYNTYLNEAPGVYYDNLIDNMFFGMGANVASDRISYAAYKSGPVLSQLGDIVGLIPGFGWLGSGMSTAGIALQVASLFGGTKIISNIIEGIEKKGIFDGLLGGIWDTGKEMLGTIGGLAKSLVNFVASPNTLGAYNKLGPNIATSGGYSPTESGSPYTKENRDYGKTSRVEVSQSSIDELVAEEAGPSWTVGDIYEFLSDDVVTVTPYVGETDILGTISNYNKITAESTVKILKIMTDIIEGNIVLTNVNVPSSMLGGTNYSGILDSLGLGTN